MTTGGSTSGRCTTPSTSALPQNAFPAEERLEVKVGKTAYARFDWNDYSIPHTHVQRTLSVLATLDTVRILDGLELLATHPRSFDRGAQIEEPSHVQALVAHKRAARAQRAQDRLHHAAPSAKPLFMRAAERGAHLGVLTRGLLALLDSHGASALEAAIAAASCGTVPSIATLAAGKRHQHLGIATW